jgi:hypothetical protein
MIELTTSLFMLASALSPMTAGAVADAVGTASESEATTTVAEAGPKDQPLTSVSIEAYVRDYFKDAPILAEIAKCESTFRQFDKEGNVLRGKVNKGDVGIMQINTYYHEDRAVKNGFDIFTIDGNLGYAKYLYGKSGDAPWVHSSKCWKKYKDATKEIAKS